MLFFILGVDQNVIYEHHYELIQILHEHFVHQVHEIGWSISQSKRHDCVLVQPIPRNERCLGYVTLSNLQLMISRLKINLREYTCTTELVKPIIDPGQWILVLDNHFVEG
jgi:hypothetical protein